MPGLNRVFFLKKNALFLENNCFKIWIITNLLLSLQCDNKTDDNNQ